MCARSWVRQGRLHLEQRTQVGESTLHLLPVHQHDRSSCDAIAPSLDPENSTQRPPGSSFDALECYHNPVSDLAAVHVFLHYLTTKSLDRASERAPHKGQQHLVNFAILEAGPVAVPEQEPPEVGGGCYEQPRGLASQSFS